MSFLSKISSTITPSSIDNLKSTLNKRKGLAKPNRFAIYMTPPEAALLNIDIEQIAVSLLSKSFNAKSLINDPRDVNILCDSCAIPGKQITTFEHSHFRQEIKIPNSYLFEDIDFSFLLTNDYYVKKMFDTWTNLVIDPVTYKRNYPSVYQRDIVIQQLDSKNIPVYGIKLINAYPTTVQSIAMSNDSSDTIQKMAVSMTYEDIAEEGVFSSTLSGIKDVIGGTNLF